MSDTLTTTVEVLKTKMEHLEQTVVMQIHLERELKPIREAQIKQGEAITQLATGMSTLVDQNKKTNEKVQELLASYTESILNAQKEKTENAKAIGGWPLVTKIFLCLSAFVAFCTILGIGYGVASLIHAAARH